MAERERTRVREREAPDLNPYELSMKLDREFQERQHKGRIVVKFGDCPQGLSRQGRLRYYLSRAVKDTALLDWTVFTHEVRTHSGRHRHQGGLIIYVVDGQGYSVVESERIDWKKGDLLLLPMQPGGVEHQHFNTATDGTPALWMAFIHQGMREYVASEITQSEPSPEYLAEQGGQ